MSTSRFFSAPAGSFFLFGPRGTGKSTWLRRHLPDGLHLDLLDPPTRRSLEARPERLEEIVSAAPPGSTIVLDEVQLVPELLPVVHRLIEAEGAWRFVLSGSSARKLRRTGVDLLAGRAVTRSMHPFMAAELGDGFDLSQALTCGLVPLVVDADDPGDTLASYASLYLDQEVRAEGLVRRIGDFGRFLEVVSFSHAAQLNVAAVARECAVGRKTVESWIEVLDDLLLSFRIPVFTRRAQRAVVAHPKFYLFDSGVFRSLRPAGPLDRPGEIDGAALEGLVAQHLRGWIDYSRLAAKLYYFRTRAGSEVDFVVYGAGAFFAIEVKNTATLRARDVKPLRAFADDYPECRTLLLYRGDPVVIGGIACHPVESFLEGLRPDESPPGLG